MSVSEHHERKLTVPIDSVRNSDSWKNPRELLPLQARIESRALLTGYSWNPLGRTN